MQKLTSILSATAFSLLLVATPVLAQQSTTTTGPSIKLITPQDNQLVYGNQIPVLFDVQGITLTDFQTNPTNVAGQGHILLWLDNQNPTVDSSTKVIKDEFSFSDISYGDHTIRAELVNNNNTSLVPAKVVTAKFKTEAIPSPSPAESSSFDKNTALVILVIVALVIVAAWWYTKEDDEDMDQDLKTTAKKPASKKAAKKKTPSAGGKKKAATRTRRK